MHTAQVEILTNRTEGDWITNNCDQALSPSDGRVEQLLVGEEAEIQLSIPNHLFKAGRHTGLPGPDRGQENGPELFALDVEDPFH